MNKQDKHIVGSKVFIAVWALLIVLTGVTVFIARLQLGNLSILGALTIASIKAGLVLWYFMHLKYESKLFKLLLFVPVTTLTIIIIFTFFDIWYR